MGCYGLWRHRSRRLVFSEAIERAEGLVSKGFTRKTFVNPRCNLLLQQLARMRACIKFQHGNLDLKFQQLGPVPGGEFPLDVGANLGLVVATLCQPFTQQSG